MKVIVSEDALPTVVLPFSEVLPETVVFPVTDKLSARVVAPVTPSVPPTVVLDEIAAVDEKVTAPVTPRVEPIAALSAFKLSTYAVPSMYKSLISLADEPMYTVSSVLG